MKIAVMSDVHANPHALDTALADARRLGCTRFLLLGDVTGYGYDAKSSLDAVRSAFDVVLLGNHDAACAGLEPEWLVMANHNYDVDRAQRETLAEADLAWLRALPEVHSEFDAAFVHGDFSPPLAWNYVFSVPDAAGCFLARDERVLFCGHTHHAAVWVREDDGAVVPKFEARLSRPATKAESASFALAKGCRYVVNVGSVGYPRADLCSTYAIYDTEKARVAVRRLPFDFKDYVMSMLSRKVQLPMWLCDLLAGARGAMR